MITGAIAIGTLAFVFGCTHVLPSSLSDPGLLTDDYGIVTLDDIRQNAKFVRPRDKDGNPLLVWQCLHLDRVEINCEPYGDDVATPNLYVTSAGKRYFFYLRHAWSTFRCNLDIETWHKILKDEKVACFSGEPSLPTDDGLNRALLSWQLDRVKSHKGSWSYFMEPDEPED
ncbi:MAG: hypothetical protein HY537_02435 [Deltaproteobacteria bacterium]|nr:hypothetical protein [Deltaproteobacteria bacterium]